METFCLKCGKKLISTTMGFVCPSCCYIKTIDEQKNNSYQEGWVCPKCGSVYSPYTHECIRCSAPYKIGCTY